MSDLVERCPKEAAMLREIAQSYSRGVDWQAYLSASAAVIDLAAARITELETALAEAGKQLRENAETLAQVPAAIAEARRQSLEEAAKACEAERLSEPQDESDAAYDRAIDHCAQAIRDMKDRT